MMFNVCHNCGQYRADKIIDPAGPFAICPLCRHPHRFRQLPLFAVSGPSGAGKSAVCQKLVGAVDDVIALDADILWRPEFDRPEDGYRDFFETWLRLGKNVGQSGRPLLLFGAGFIPDNVEPCIERRYFGPIHYLALIADDATLTNRLQARPAWRQSQDEAFIASQIGFNHWFQERPQTAEPEITLLNTTDMPIDHTVEQVRIWIRRCQPA